ncbi:MAG: hypothetical protein WC593_12580 [Methanoregula sp.]
MYLKKKGTIKPLGTGYCIIECDNIDITLPENKELIEKIVSDAKKIRGEVISLSLDIEYYLNEIIGFFFIGDNRKQMEMFNECILQKEFFTFGEKLKVLNFLLTNNSEKFHLESAKKRREIITTIRKVMEYRNKFAHEDIVINFKERKAFILDNKGENLLSPKSVLDWYQKICDLTLVHISLYSNLVSETYKESLNEEKN